MTPDAMPPADASDPEKSPTARPASAQAASPMMAQYLEIKAQYPGALLFYRMGDFFELFFEDAKAAATALDLTLTKRGNKHLGEDVPMCGVPARAAEVLGRLRHSIDNLDAILVHT
ncbi:MAG: hypothetical protein AAGL49_13805, partial [Pseudomonadota bacterium]